MGQTAVGNPNHALFLLLNASAQPSGAVVLLATVCAKYLIALVPLHLALLWFGGGRTERFVALAAAVSLLLAFAASGLFGILFDTPRPFVIGLGHTVLEHRPSASFPSNHALLFFTYASVLVVFGRQALALAVAVLGLVVGWSRIYLGIHFPLDIVGAALLGGLAAFAGAKIMTRHGDVVFALAERIEARALSLARRRRVG